MKKILFSALISICILTSCTPSNNEGINDTDIDQAKTELTKADDYTLVLEEPEDTMFPHSFLTSYDKEEDTSNYVKISEGHMWEVKKAGRTTYNSEGRETDKNINVLIKRCDEIKSPCILFPYNEQKNYPLSFQFCMKENDSVSFTIYNDTNMRDAPVDPEKGKQNYWFELTQKGRLFYKTTYGYGSYEITNGNTFEVSDETGGEPHGQPFFAEEIKADVWNKIDLILSDDRLIIRLNEEHAVEICGFDRENAKTGGFLFGGSEGLMIKDIVAGDTVQST